MTCCTDSCCGPGSYCCAHTMPHDHDEDGRFIPVPDIPPPNFDPEPLGRLKEGRDEDRLRRELSRVVNASSIDNELGMPDFVIADMICNFLQSVVNAQTATTIWKNS